MGVKVGSVGLIDARIVIEVFGSATYRINIAEINLKLSINHSSSVTLSIPGVSIFRAASVKSNVA